MTVISRPDLDRQMRAIDLFRAGCTMHQIAHEMQVTPATVDKWLTAWGIVRRCASCTAILEAHEKDTCDWCKGGRRICRVPLPTPEVTEPVNLREVFRYG
jgi:rRNA maturation endonuclease Nob1